LGGEPFRSTYCREKTQISDTVGQVEEAFGGHLVTDGHAHHDEDPRRKPIVPQPPRGPPRNKGRGRWKKGESGNLSSRKRSPDDIKQAFKALAPRGIQTLQCALYEAPWSARAAAAREILNSHLGSGAAERLVEHSKQ
jgi:hypothetical protein